MSSVRELESEKVKNDDTKEWETHMNVNQPLQLLGASFGPVALVLVGITLAQTPVGENFKGALKISVVKTFVHPMLMAAAGYGMGMRGLHLAVMVVMRYLAVMTVT